MARALRNYIYRPHPKDGGRYCFQFVCQSTSRGGGVPQSGRGGIPHLRSWGVPHSRSGWGGTPSQVWLGGDPIPGLARGRGYPIPGLDPLPPGPGQDGVPPDQVWMGYPPRPGMGYLPETWDGVPPLRPGIGYPPRPGMGYPLPRPPPNWDIASTCYAAGGMPLAFTQEDFLV